MHQNKTYKKLKTGFTTGTCATAASKAAILSIMNQKKIDEIEVTLPNKKHVIMKINSCVFQTKHSRCSVIKYGGDDPDVTHGAEIITDVYLTNHGNKIEIYGGKGVGIVTKPGLGLEIGKAAINNTPKKMIINNINELFSDLLKKKGIKIIISVPNGDKIAKHTDNPRLGIKNGISILGTSGIVIPYSTASFAASIRQNLDVCVATNNTKIALSVGSRSEEYIKNIIKIPNHCFVQMGDFAGYTMSQCVQKKIKMAYIVGLIAKFAKISTGIKQTHVKGSKVNMIFLSKLAKKCNTDSNTLKLIKTAHTARHVYEIIKEKKMDNFFNELCIEVYKQMRKHSESKIVLNVILFDFDGNIIGRYP
ncbi:MAG: cobalt-precorrin-5B (C(1))-methyltransferase [Thaumarchaeota archaeon]|nr:cobalt-precorrin-5B (C(1))-methyltransferase [Nitrososphaerota archaeon]